MSRPPRDEPRGGPAAPAPAAAQGNPQAAAYQRGGDAGDDLAVLMRALLAQQSGLVLSPGKQPKRAAQQGATPVRCMGREAGASSSGCDTSPNHTPNPGGIDLYCHQLLGQTSDLVLLSKDAGVWGDLQDLAVEWHWKPMTLKPMTLKGFSQTIAAATQGLDPEWSPLLIMILGVADLLPGCERGSQAWADASPLVYELRRADAGVRVNNVKALRIEEALQAPGPAQKALASKLALFRELEARSTEVVCTALDTLLRCDGATLDGAPVGSDVSCTCIEVMEVIVVLAPRRILEVIASRKSAATIAAEVEGMERRAVRSSIYLDVSGKVGELRMGPPINDDPPLQSRGAPLPNVWVSEPGKWRPYRPR